MKILSWYVARDFLRYLLLCLTAMALLLLAAKLFNDIETVFSSWADFFRFLLETVRGLPTLFEIIHPIAVLLATVITFTRLSRSSELLAIKGSGMGNGRLILPLFAVLVPISLLVYLNQNYLFAALNPGVNKPSTGLQNNQWRSAGETIFFLSRADPAKNRLEKGFVFRHQTDPFQLSEITSFASGEQASPGWVFHDVTRRQKKPTKWLFERSQRWEVPSREFPNLYTPQEIDAHHMPFFELYREIRQLEKRNVNIVVYLLEWYQKTAVLFAPFILVLVAAPLSQFHFRQGHAAGELVVTLFGGVVYWISNEILLILGKGGVMPPFGAAWGVNLTFLIFGLALLRFAR